MDKTLRPAEQSSDGDYHLVVTAAELGVRSLAPSAYHTRIDLLSENSTAITTDDSCGSVAFYIMLPGERPAAALGSFFLASVASFALDRASGMVAYTWSTLPPTGDPLGPRWRAGKVRKTPSWPRSWANFSLLSLYSHRNAWTNLHLLGQPDTFLA